MNGPNVAEIGGAVYTLSDVARLLKLSDETIRVRTNAGKIPGVFRTSERGGFRFTRTTIDKWIADGCPPVKKAEG